jgi:chromosome partitioning protein
MTKRLLIASPKGGAGKTTLAWALAVAAVRAGINLATVDFDPQRTLSDRHGRRTGDMPTWPNYALDMSDAADLAQDDLDGCELIIIDTPPSVESAPVDFWALVNAADLLLIPSRPTVDDAKPAIPLMRLARSCGRPTAFVLNAVKPKVNFRAIKAALDAAGPVCPFELADRYDHARAAERGIGLVEAARHEGAAEVEDLWQWVRRELWGRQ